MKTIALLFSLLLTLVSASAEQLEPGAFTLRMTVPEMAEKDIELDGTLKLAEKKFTFETVDVGGDPITLQGILTKDGLLMWISKDEHDYLVTFHLTGVFSDNKEKPASGKISVFKDHERVAHGEWQLQKRSEQAGTEQPATRPESKSEGGDKPQPDAEGRSR